MKKLSVVLLLIIMFASCSKPDPSTETESLQSQYDDLQSKYEDLLEKSSDVSLHQSMDDLLISKWGSTLFDDATAYIIDDNKSGLITTLEETEDTDIDILVSKILVNIQTIPSIINDNDCSLMYIKVVDTEGLPIIEVFIDASDTDNIKTEFMASNKFMDIVNKSISELNSVLDK